LKTFVLLLRFTSFSAVLWTVGLLLAAYLPLQLLKWASHLPLTGRFVKSQPHLGHFVVSWNLFISWLE